MTVQVTALGPNSAQLYYTNADTLTDIVTAVDGVMIAHGWTLHDYWNSKAIVYKALNADGVTYKYVMLDYRTAGKMKTTLYDNWDSTTHSAISGPATSSDDAAYCQRLSVGGTGYINIFVNSRWLALYNRPADGIYGDDAVQSATIITEYARDTPEDAAGITPYIPVVFGTVASLMGRYPLNSNYYAGQSCFSAPRDRMGSTGTDAMRYNAVATICGRSVPEVDLSAEPNSYFGLWQCLPVSVNLWNQKNYAFTMYAGAFGFQTYRGIMGRLFGIKAITLNAGLGMDTIMIPTDGEYFHSPTGTPTQHFVLGDSKGDRIAIPA